YVVATKHIGQKLAFTGGIGWGRLGSFGGFSNPLGFLSNRFKTRPGGIGSTGQVSIGRYFRGDAAFFGGVEYRPTDHLSFKLEYSSDAQTRESSVMGVPHRSPFNFGASYRFANGVDLTAAYLYGSSVGVMLNYTFNPKHPAYPGGTEEAGPPVVPRDYAAAASWGRLAQTAPEPDLAQAAKTSLAAERITLQSFSRSGSTITLHILNTRFDAVPEAIGRAARALTAVMPPEIETFVFIPVNASGMALSSVTIQRSDLEELDHALDQSWDSFARAKIADAATVPERRDTLIEGTYPKLSYRFSGYFLPSYFDPDDPVRADLGLQLRGQWNIAPGLSFSGAIR
ncbi:YjbH domain-containing protein, partial [Thioclava sp. BHET1]